MFFFSYKETHASPHFHPIDLSSIYNRNTLSLDPRDCTPRAIENVRQFPGGRCIFMGIPFETPMPDAGTPNVLLINEGVTNLRLPEPFKERQIVFLHTVDFNPHQPQPDGLFRPMRGNPALGQVVAEYSFRYDDGTMEQLPIRRRFNIGEPARNTWGEYCFEAVPHWKDHATRTSSEDIMLGNKPQGVWGATQFRAVSDNMLGAPYFYLYTFENPHPDKGLEEICFAPKGGVVFLFAMSTADLATNPLRWEARQKAVLHVPGEQDPAPYLDGRAIDIDLGSVIHVSPLLDYPRADWEGSYIYQQPTPRTHDVLVEYTANRAAHLHLGIENARLIPVNALNQSYEPQNTSNHDLKVTVVRDNVREVRLRVTEKGSSHPVPVKLHIHGEAGEYLPPMNRQRFPNWIWLEDHNPDWVHGLHNTTYIDGEARLKLPLGKVYLEITKGFEIAPVKRVLNIDGTTDVIHIELDHVLPWRQQGWVSADTHVHFISPVRGLLEGEAEGVNVVNLLATQWAEWFTNVGDFDGKRTFGSREMGGDGEYLLRVATENRMHVLGHISLLGYEGEMILPLVAGGPEESALGTPINITMTEWAEQCRAQNGLAILPHHPLPRGEAPAAVILGQIDGIEMTSWELVYAGISPYSLSDYYRFLNCGYQVPIVGGTDKMAGDIAVGTVRTYTHTGPGPYTYDTWKQAIRRGETFVTHGPLIEFFVNGKPMGSRIELGEAGGTVDVTWQVASVTIPVTRVELVVNGETREVFNVEPGQSTYAGSFSLTMNSSGWVALRVRGCQPGKPEIITAHSSSIMIYVNGTRPFNVNDAVTILEQIEGATAFIRTVGTRAEEQTFKRVMMKLTSAHRALHNLMHQNGHYHEHTVVDEHHNL